MRMLILLAVAAASTNAVSQQLEDGKVMTITGSFKTTRTFGLVDGRAGEVLINTLVPRDYSPQFPGGLLVKPAPITGLADFPDLPSVEVAADCIIRVKRSEKLPICELRSYAATETTPTVSYHERQRQEDIEAAEIKMKSFDPKTAGRTAIVFATSIDEITPRPAMVTILYRDTPCSLPFADAKHLRAGETLYGRALVPACWGKLVTPLNDEIVIITKFGDSRRDSLINYAEMRISPDGSGRFIKPAYSSGDYRNNLDEYHKALR